MLYKQLICRILIGVAMMAAPLSGLRAQEKLDSMRLVVTTMPDDTAKLSCYDYICNYIYNVDSAGKYSQLMLDLAQKLNEQRYMALAYGYRSRYCLWANKHSEALDASVESLNLWDKLDDKYNIALTNMSLAIILTAQGQFESASRYYHISLDAFSELGDSVRITQVLQNLGNMNSHVRYYQNAINYFEQARTIDSLTNNIYGLIADHTGLARVYVNKYKRRRRDSLANEYLMLSKHHLDTAYKLALPIPNVIEMQQLHIYMGMVYMEMADELTGKAQQAALDSCQAHCERLLKLRSDYNLKSNKSGVITLLGRVQMRRGNMAKALEYLKEADKLENEEHPRREIKKEILLAYMQYYELKGDLAKANHYLKELTYLLVEGSTDEAAARVAQSKSKAEFEHKMRQRAIEEYEHELQYKAQAERQRLMLIVIISSLVVITIIITISGLRRKKLNLQLKHQNMMLDEKNYQLSAAKEELLSQNEQLDRANKNITDSIVYAKHIQEAVIPTPELMQLIFGDCLVLLRPCNIVSGDFFWAVCAGRYKALAVADCTGHGVPGALMSMLGASMLNDIISNSDMNSTELHASDVLNKLRLKLIRALRQDLEQSESSTFDGMDVAFVLIDTERHKLQYSGAFRPLVIIRNDELSILEPNRMPIGTYLGKQASFTNHIVDIEPGDTIYAYSDGYTDQFCNTDSFEKFGRRRLYSMLLDNYKKPFDEQHTIFNDTFEKWRRNNPEGVVTEQTDDVLLVGIRV